MTRGISVSQTNLTDVKSYTSHLTKQHVTTDRSVEVSSGIFGSGHITCTANYILLKRSYIFLPQNGDDVLLIINQVKMEIFRL